MLYVQVGLWYQWVINSQIPLRILNPWILRSTEGLQWTTGPDRKCLPVTSGRVLRYRKATCSLPAPPKDSSPSSFSAGRPSEACIGCMWPDLLTPQKASQRHFQFASQRPCEAWGSACVSEQLPCTSEYLHMQPGVTSGHVQSSSIGLPDAGLEPSLDQIHRFQTWR